MKRGNTALKRGVGLASAFALAIAGAVIAAPAASAAAGDFAQGANIRTMPLVDAAWAAKDGTARTSIDAGATYDSSHATGTAKYLTGSNQMANGFQIVLESGDTGAAARWADGEVITVALANAKFNTTPAVSISPLSKISGSGSILYVAGVSGEHATLPTAVGIANSDLALQSGATLASSNTQLKLTLKGDPHKVAPADAGTQGYVITVSGVKVNVDGSAAQGDPITATLTSATSGVFDDTPSVNGGVATIANVGALALSAANGGVDAGATSPQTLPVVTLSETTVKGLQTGAKVLTVANDGASSTTVFAGVPTAAVSGSTTLTATPSNFTTASNGTVTIGGTVVDTAIESVALTGIKVSTIPADASKLTIGLTGSAGSVTNNAISFYPLGAGVTVDIPIVRPEQRYAGASRYETAGKIAAALVPSNDATTIVLANGTDMKNGADALAANFLNAPVLLTDSSAELPKATADALKDLTKSTGGNVTIYAFGKTDSVSQAARNQAAVIVAGANSANRATVTEVAGSNRYATSAAAASTSGYTIGAYSLKSGEPFLKTAFLASGKTNADALAAGAASANLDIPVLLADGGTLDDSVAKAIDDLGIQQLFVLGGTDRVSDAAVDQAKAKGVTSVYRIAGADRYATAAALYTFIGADPTKGPGLGETYDAKAFLASGGAGWPDALTVGPLAGSGSNVAPVLTTGADTLASAAETFLKDNKATVNDIWAVGGPDRVSADVLKAAQALSK